jgi:hypothetical protein
VQVLVLQRLLRARGISGRLHLGVRRPDRCETDPPGGANHRLAGHAWVQCGDTVVNGARNYRDYEIIATFAW